MFVGALVLRLRQCGTWESLLLCMTLQIQQLFEVRV